jgi:hypothetical protein
VLSFFLLIDVDTLSKKFQLLLSDETKFVGTTCYLGTGKSGKTANKLHYVGSNYKKTAKILHF